MARKRFKATMAKQHSFKPGEIIQLKGRSVRVVYIEIWRHFQEITVEELGFLDKRAGKLTLAAAVAAAFIGSGVLFAIYL